MKRCLFNPNTAMIILIPAVVTFNFIVIGDPLTISECQPSGRITISDDGNAHSTFTCNGFRANETAQWVLRHNGVQKFSVTCGQSCDNTNSNVNVSRPMASSSIFTIARSFWKKYEYASVICSSTENVSNLYTCNTNVIYPPKPTTVQTHSSRSPGSPSTPPSSTRANESGSQSTPPSSTRANESGSQSTPPSSTRANESGSQSTPPSSTRANESAQTTTDGNEEKDDGLPIAAIAGGAAAFLVIIIIIIVIVVVVVVRRRKRQKKAHADNNVLEEHVNPMYGSGDEPETASPSNSKPSGVALRIPTDTSNNAATLEDADNVIDAGYSSMAFVEQHTTLPASATSPTGQSSPNTASQPGFPTSTTTPVVVTDADLYTAVDGMEQVQTSGPVQDHAAGYSTVGSPNNSATDAPSGDVYAVVQKSGPRAQSASAITTVSPSNLGDSADDAFVDVSRSSAPAPPSKAPSGDPVSDNADNTYAVVNKSSSRGKGTGDSTSPDTSNRTQQAPSGDVYAQVNKSSKRNGSTPENDGEGQSYLYAQVDKTSKGNNPTPVQQTQAQDQKPEIKPKPALKPKPSSNV